MKILFAIQGTGNGHLSRARDIIPYLKEYGDLDIMVSGTEVDVKLTYPVKYRSKGLSFHYNKKAGIHYFKTLWQNPPQRILREIRQFPVEKYDLVINDFEPITAWACRKKGQTCIALSHQSAFLSQFTPRPEQKSRLGEFILQHYAPVQHAVGFHFKPYDDFIHTPVIRQAIRNAKVTDEGHYTVYLPAMSEDLLIQYLQKIPEVEWHVFSRYTNKQFRNRNILIQPVENESFIRSFTSCTGILTSAGFETPSEALFMGKKLCVSPIIGQYEQDCNAVALQEMGVKVLHRINEEAIPGIRKWIHVNDAIQIDFPDHAQQIIETLLNTFATKKPIVPRRLETVSKVEFY